MESYKYFPCLAKWQNNKKKGDGMYGLFNIPCSVKSSEQKEYRNYMCTLCDSLHEDYGIKGRLLTNYDSTTLLC